MPVTDYWRQGELVKGDNSIKKGTVIATFDENGRYPKPVRSSENHGAIYISQNEEGIQVIDQWKGKGLGANYRTIKWGGRHAWAQQHWQRFFGGCRLSLPVIALEGI